MKAISSMATRHVLADLNVAAVAAGHPELRIESLGGVDAADRVANGEQLDIVFLEIGALKKLAADGHVDAESLAPLVLSQVAVGVASGTDSPAGRPDGYAFEDAASMRKALLAAKRIGYSTGPSGTALVKMIDNWGLTDALGPRLVQAQAGVPVARSLVEGDVDLGFQQLSELVGQPGVKILGVLPPDCAIDTIFAGAVASTAADPVAAGATLKFFASAAASSIKQAHHFAEPSKP